MTRVHRAPVIAHVVTDKQRILDELEKAGCGFGRRPAAVTVEQLYRRVVALERRAADDPDVAGVTGDAQWLFLRRWLEDRQRRTATRREPPAFQAFVYPPGMRAVLARCREHAHCRSDPDFA